MVFEEYIFVTCDKKINEGKRKVLEYLSEVDKTKLDKYMKEQIQLVGGEIIYTHVNNCLKEEIVELSLLKELCKLYKWRQTFFDEHLPVLGGSWFTDSFCRDVVTYQITENFDQILKLASSRKIQEGTYATGLFLTSDGNYDRRIARYRIHNLEILYNIKSKGIWDYFFLTEYFLPGSHLLFSDVAKIISDHWTKSPMRLEEIAMKTVKKEFLNNTKLPDHLMFNDKYGFYSPQQETPLHLKKEGQELFNELKLIYDRIKSKYV